MVGVPATCAAGDRAGPVAKAAVGVDGHMKRDPQWPQRPRGRGRCGSVKRGAPTWREALRWARSPAMGRGPLGGAQSDFLEGSGPYAGVAAEPPAES